MVGALSIVRFRTAVKEPMDIAFLFWAIAAGIVIGSGMILLAVCGSVFIGIILTLFANKKSTDNPFILVIDCENQEAEKRVLDTVSRSVKKHMVKSKTVSAKGIELTMEVRLKEMSTDLLINLPPQPVFTMRSLSVITEIIKRDNERLICCCLRCERRILYGEQTWKTNAGIFSDNRLVFFGT